MSDDTLRVARLLGPEGPVARRLPGYELRNEQLELAQAVERAFAEGRHLLAEAGTGVGKSFAYLLPAVVHALARNGQGPIVVSTRTIALQEQLDRKDLPFLQSILPLEWSAVTAIGRANYVCLRRMELARREQGALFPDAERAADLQRVLDWSMTTLEGTRQSFDEPVDDRVWEEVKAEHGNCLNRACKHYERCHWQRARRRMESAQILVVNHALYMSDVALRAAGARYLPAHATVVFDEAHHLERVATEQLGLQFGRPTLLWHLGRLHPRKSRRSLLRDHGSTRAREIVETLRRHADEWFEVLQARARSGPASRSQAIALEDSRLDEPFTSLLLELQREVISSAAGVEDVDLKMELQARAAGLVGLVATIGALCTNSVADSVRWIETTRAGPVLRSAPLDPSEMLRKHVFGQERTAVLVSATLGIGGDRGFGWLRSKLGIDRAETLRLGSPFDYGSAVEVEVIDGMPDPARDAAAHLRACIRVLRGRIVENGGRALILCTSWAAVRNIADGLGATLEAEGLPLLVQGEAPLRQLLQRKRDEPESVLIGTDSLWEGIDVPGDALTLVAMTKLPFAQPDHPLTKARHRRIEEQGGNPFADASLPEAILRFRQGFGRLVRTTEDRGVVLVLDPRVRTKRYGPAFLEALPEGALDVVSPARAEDDPSRRRNRKQDSDSGGGAHHGDAAN
jgi:ATP-dependent DNA helicase DinG